MHWKLDLGADLILLSCTNNASMQCGFCRSILSERRRICLSVQEQNKLRSVSVYKYKWGKEGWTKSGQQVSPPVLTESEPRWRALGLKSKRALTWHVLVSNCCLLSSMNNGAEFELLHSHYLFLSAPAASTFEDLWPLFQSIQYINFLWNWNSCQLNQSINELNLKYLPCDMLFI